MKLLGSLDTPPSSGQQAPPRAEVAVFETITSVLVQTANDAAGSIGMPADVYHGKVFRLTETIYLALTFTDNGTLIVTGGALGDRRRISSHVACRGPTSTSTPRVQPEHDRDVSERRRGTRIRHHRIRPGSASFTPTGHSLASSPEQTMAAGGSPLPASTRNRPYSSAVRHDGLSPSTR